MELGPEQSFSIKTHKSQVAKKPSISVTNLTMAHDDAAVYKPSDITTTTTPTSAISSFAAPPFHGGSAAVTIGSVGSSAAPELVKKKRGRSRKHASDGGMAIASDSPASKTPPGIVGFSPVSVGHANSDFSVLGDPMKKSRGKRPMESQKKKQLFAPVRACKTFATPMAQRRKKAVDGCSNGNASDKVEAVPEDEELLLLESRCFLANFVRRIRNWQINDREWALLRRTPFGRLIKDILELDMNMEIVDALLGFWDEEHCGFLIGGIIIPFTVDDIALIVGLPNRGQKIVRQRVKLKCDPEFSWIYLNMTNIERRVDNILINRNNPSPEADKCFVQQMILYLWVSVLFPSSCRILPAYMTYYVKNIDSIGSYNWAEALHSFLVRQINVKSKIVKERNEGKEVVVGCMNGLSFAIVAWFFEHVDFGEDSRPSNPEVRPRMLKWAKGCKFWQRKPFLQRFRDIVADKVFHRLLPKNDEFELISLNSVEHMPSQSGGAEISSLTQTVLKQLERISVLERRIVNLETLAASKGWEIEGRNDQITGKVDEQVGHDLTGTLHESCIEGDKNHTVEVISHPKLSSITRSEKQGCRQYVKRKTLKLTIAKEHLMLKRRRDIAINQASIPSMEEKSSARLKRKGTNMLVNIDDYACPTEQKQEAKVAPLNYAGRELLTENVRKYLDAFCIKPMQRSSIPFFLNSDSPNYISFGAGSTYLVDNQLHYCFRDDIVFFHWNICIRRQSMVEYLQGGYTSEEIIDAYALILYEGVKMSGNNSASFLYVPPMFLGLYRNKLGSYKTFLNAVNKKSLEKVKLLFFPCHVSTANHWLLLVCDMKMRKWIGYDSLYDPRHREAAKEQITLLTEYLYEDHGFDIKSLNLQYRRIYPQQEPGTLDCGIFVMKFIERIMSVPMEVNFRGNDMKLFRPQIACKILQH